MRKVLLPEPVEAGVLERAGEGVETEAEAEAEAGVRTWGGERWVRAVACAIDLASRVVCGRGFHRGRWWAKLAFVQLARCLKL